MKTVTLNLTNIRLSEEAARAIATTANAFAITPEELIGAELESALLMDSLTPDEQGASLLEGVIQLYPERARVLKPLYHAHMESRRAVYRRVDIRARALSALRSPTRKTERMVAA